MSLCGTQSFGTVHSTFGKRTTLCAFAARLVGVPAGAPVIPEFLIYFNYLSPQVTARKRAALALAATSPRTRPSAPRPARAGVRRASAVLLKNLLDSALPSDLRSGRIWKYLLEEDFRCGSEDHGFGRCVSP